MTDTALRRGPDRVYGHPIFLPRPPQKSCLNWTNCLNLRSCWSLKADWLPTSCWSLTNLTSCWSWRANWFPTSCWSLMNCLSLTSHPAVLHRYHYRRNRQGLLKASQPTQVYAWHFPVSFCFFDCIYSAQPVAVQFASALLQNQAKSVDLHAPPLSGAAWQALHPVPDRMLAIYQTAMC